MLANWIRMVMRYNYVNNGCEFRCTQKTFAGYIDINLKF